LGNAAQQSEPELAASLLLRVNVALITLADGTANGVTVADHKKFSILWSK